MVSKHFISWILEQLRFCELTNQLPSPLQVPSLLIILCNNFRRVLAVPCLHIPHYIYFLIQNNVWTLLDTCNTLSEIMHVLPDSKLGTKHTLFYILCVWIHFREANEDLSSFTNDSYVQIILFHALFAWEKIDFADSSFFSWCTMVKKDFLDKLYAYMSNEKKETIWTALGWTGEGRMSLI